MEIVLRTGDSVQVSFFKTDGLFKISFEETRIVVEEIAGLSDIYGRGGVIYEERFGLGERVSEDKIG